MNRPFISVIIPTCHRNDSLALCLERLAPGSQEGMALVPAGGKVEPKVEKLSYEVIVSDDGSKETAEELIQNQYSWATWVEGPRQGPASNRNNGALVTRGEWLAFTDDDCLPESQWLCAYALNNSPEILVYEGRTITDEPDKGFLYTAPVNEDGGFLWSCNFLMRKDLFEELKGFDEQFPHPHMEDVDLRYRIKKAGVSFNFVPEAVVLHPQRLVTLNYKRVLGHESTIHFWHKHALGIKYLNDWFISLARNHLRNVMKKARRKDKMRYVAYCIFEASLLPWFLIYWIIKHHNEDYENSP